MTDRISRATLTDGQVSAAVLSLGAVMQEWVVPSGGRRVPVILGYADPEAYRSDPFYIGAIVGRVANRIGGASYVNNGQRIPLKANHGRHQLHGGSDGISMANWQLETDGPRAVRLTHLSPNGAGGFPGGVEFVVDIRLRGARITWDMRATPDCETPISLAQHNYYRLAAPVPEHRLRVTASQRLESDADLIPTGTILPAPGWHRPRALVAETGLLDGYLLFDADRDPALPVAEVASPSGLRLRLWSDQPGTTVYTGQSMTPAPGGLPGMPIDRLAGFCIEPSGLIDAPNHAEFPSILHSPERPYRQVLQVEIAAENAP